jgi:hypothetical protein
MIRASLHAAGIRCCISQFLRRLIACRREKPADRRSALTRKSQALFPALDAPHHGFADADDEIIQPSVFFFAGIECLLQSGIVALTT